MRRGAGSEDEEGAGAGSDQHCRYSISRPDGRPIVFLLLLLLASLNLVPALSLIKKKPAVRIFFFLCYGVLRLPARLSARVIGLHLVTFSYMFFSMG
jgi:hypothetical protein